MFNVSLLPRAVPATPGERLGASAVPLPETCGLRVVFRRSASPPQLTRLHLGSLRATARGFAAGGLPTDRQPGPASAGYLTTSRRGPRYPTAQRFIGVGSSHPTRYTPLARRTKTPLRSPSCRRRGRPTRSPHRSDQRAAPVVQSHVPFHRVRDPRAAALERAATRLGASGLGGARLSLARVAEREAEALLAERHPERPLRANVEFYTAVLLDAIGIPRALFSPTFAVSRVVGWCAHYDEQRRRGRLMRPLSRYVGSMPAAAETLHEGLDGTPVTASAREAAAQVEGEAGATPPGTRPLPG